MTHKKFIYFILFIFLFNCSTQKVTRIHGTLSLKSFENKVILNKTNTNDVLNLLGEPSTKSTFDDKIWIYIEQKKQNRSIVKLGKQYIKVNNTLVLYFNSKGLVYKKEFYNKDKLKVVKFAKKETVPKYSNNSFMYNFLSSFRDKINAPFRKTKIK